MSALVALVKQAPALSTVVNRLDEFKMGLCRTHGAPPERRPAVPLGENPQTSSTSQVCPGQHSPDSISMRRETRRTCRRTSRSASTFTVRTNCFCHWPYRCTMLPRTVSALPDSSMSFSRCWPIRPGWAEGPYPHLRGFLRQLVKSVSARSEVITG